MEGAHGGELSGLRGCRWLIAHRQLASGGPSGAGGAESLGSSRTRNTDELESRSRDLWSLQEVAGQGPL